MREGGTGLILRIYVTLLLLFLAAPILLVVFVSFNAGSAVQFPPRGYSLFWYKTLLENEALLQTAYNSLELASLATLLSMAIGVPAAMALVRHKFWGREAIQALLLSP